MSGYGFAYDHAGTKCSGGPEPGAEALRAGVLELEPRLVDLGIYNCRPVRGGTTLSLHGEGRAWDAGTVNGRALGDWLAPLMVDQAELLGVQEVIWQLRRWDSSSRAWSPYGGVDPHTGHVHVGLCRAAAAELTITAVRAILAPPATQEDDMPYPLIVDNEGDATPAHAGKGWVYMVTPRGPVHVVNPSSLVALRSAKVVELGGPTPVPHAQIIAWVA